MIRILIADDHTVIRQGLQKVCGEDEELQIVDEAKTGSEALQFVWNNSYDVVILDISLPGRHGIEVMKEMKKDKPDLPILVLSVHSEKQYAVRSIRAGASGYLTKDQISGELINAIRKVASGGKYITEQVSELLLSDLQNNDNGKMDQTQAHNKLTDREYEVFHHLAKGKTVSEIGEELMLSEKTINTYRHRILKKLDLDSTALLTRYAYEQGLVL
ncbi:MAG: response regulator transcription factor [Candidatus Marinimicrobia bacterium]|nr:response regulator transcription factor [Candidatus Neomarinimicrobiota bacterium]